MNANTNPLLSALEQLRLKLLDLTGRNRLINFKHTPGKSLQFVECQLGEVYQKLVESNSKSSVNILGLPEPLKRDWVEKNGRLQRPDIREWASKHDISIGYEIDPDDGYDEVSLRALLYSDDLAKHCRKIEREANLAIEETGANMLFLVLGFLEFPDQRSSDKLFQAPLISVPVALQKREVAGIQQFSLVFTGDDIAENLSLREKLKNDFGIILPSLNEDEINVDEYLDSIYEIIKDYPDFQVKRRVSICLLSFSNMLLVRDLEPGKWPNLNNVNGLIDHPIVKQVFEGSSGELPGGLDIAEDHQVEEGPGANLALVYDADSSQHSALIDALAHKKNLVIEGPPGTGKSQTITNLIAASIAEGKKVLFVAEKLAALEVVKNRLSLAGLDPFVLELHSNKANKKRVLEEIAKRIAFRSSNPTDLPKLQQQLEAHRADLRAYTNLINSISHNALGLTLHQVMWRAEKHRQKIDHSYNLLSQIEVEDASEISDFEFNRRSEYLDYLGGLYKTIDGYDENSAYWGFSPKNLVPGDEIAIGNIFKSANDSVERFKEAAEAYAEYLGESIKGLNGENGQNQLKILNDFRRNVNEGLPFDLVKSLFDGDESGKKSELAITEVRAQIHEYDSHKKIVDLSIKDESIVSVEEINLFKKFITEAKSLGVDLVDLAQLKELSTLIQSNLDLLDISNKHINEFTSQSSIEYDESYKRISELNKFSELLLDAPTHLFDLQSKNLQKQRAVEEIQRLKNVQDDWANIREKLDQQIYLDSLPPQNDLRIAISVLREGDAWYRIFQSRWRKAVGLHKSLLKNKVSMPAKDRLSCLEDVNRLNQLKEQSMADDAWGLYLDKTSLQEPIDLSGYLNLAIWNRDLKNAIELIQIEGIDLEGLDATVLKKLQKEYENLHSHLEFSISSFDVLLGIFKKSAQFIGLDTVKGLIAKARVFKDQLDYQAELLNKAAISGSKIPDLIQSIDAIASRIELKNKLQQNKFIKELLANHYDGTETNCDDILELISVIQTLMSQDLPGAIKANLIDNNFLGSLERNIDYLESLVGHLVGVDTFVAQLTEYGDFDLFQWVSADIKDDLVTFVCCYEMSLFKAVENTHLLLPWSMYITQSDDGFDMGLSDFIKILESGKVLPDLISHAYRYCVYATIIRSSFKSIPALGRFNGLRHTQIRDEFQRLDKEIISLRGKSIAHENSKRLRLIPGRSGARVDEKTEMVLLNYLIPQQRPRMPVRKMLMRAGQSVQQLKPCFMMGPQAVAQYLTPGAMHFDLVIMDEASQLKPEEAIGAIARGSQLIVVGDPKQLPPTSFFSRLGQAGEEEEEFSTTDAESILDVCSSHFKPIRSLRWHYRSQHHSLIAFSNKNFYRNNLVVFPSPYGQSGKLGVRAVYLKDAIYENNTNLREAKRVVDAAVEHITTRSKESLGIVTLNIKQRDLISELLEDKLRSVQGAPEYREYWASEGQPLFIKNLENVQGDERDAIIISTTFGKAPGTNVVRQNFGPISKQGGWRRLNVLFTRAKRSVSVFTSMRPEDFPDDPAMPLGTKALKDYLEFARSGLLVTTEDTNLEPDSDFEVAVIDVLKARGYEVTPQLGVAGYRIDIAVKHPNFPGAYLAAIECDGATYHSALSVRDRDRIRQEILESLGWRGRVWRIWSTDWFRSPKQEAEKLFSFLDDKAQTWRPDHAAGERWIEEGANEPVINDSQVNLQKYNQPSLELQVEKDQVTAALIEDDIEVELGDTVNYVDLEKPADILTVQIVSGQDDFANGIINQSRPLAKALLGGVIGDELVLNLPGKESRTLHILEILKLKKVK